MKFGKIKAAATSFLDRYKTNDPATYAAAQQAVGGLLILDGFIGIDNPLGGKKRSGIFGCLSGIVLGFIFLFVPTIFGAITGSNHLTSPTTATVVSVGQAQTSTDSKGNTSSACAATVSYTVDGKVYTPQSSLSSSSMCSLTKGSTITVKYDPANPSLWGYDLDSLNFFLKIFSVVGGIVIVISVFTFIIRLLSIIFGWKILMSGRALAKTLPTGANFGSVVEQIKQEFSKHVFGAGPTGGLLQELQSFQAPAPQPPIIPTTSSPQAPENSYVVTPPQNTTDPTNPPSTTPQV